MNNLSSVWNSSAQTVYLTQSAAASLDIDRQGQNKNYQHKLVAVNTYDELIIYLDGVEIARRPNDPGGVLE